MPEDYFGDVTPTAGIVTLQELKTHLRFPDPTAASDDDAALQGFIYAATEVVEFHAGRIVQRQVTEFHDGGDYVIFTKQKPVVSVVEVIENWGYFNWTLADQPSTSVPAANLFAYSLDNPAEGHITRRSVGNVAIPFMAMGGMFPDNVKVTYVAGRSETPWACRLACLELCAHWWQNSQQRSYSSTTSAATSYDAMVQDSAASAYLAGVPYRIVELLKPHKRTPVIG